MSGIRYNSGRERYLGPLSPIDPEELPPQKYEGAVIYGDDGVLYYSDGTDWLIPGEQIDIGRPTPLEPVTTAQRTQLRMSTFTSNTGKTQTGVVFEVSLTNDFTNPLFTRTIVSNSASFYQLVYPDDGLTPDSFFWWRGRYVGTGDAQSAFSPPFQQEYPPFIDVPIPVTPNEAITASVDVQAYESAFFLPFYALEVEIYAMDGVTLVATATSLVSQTRVVLPNTLVEGTQYRWRARHVGRATPSSPLIYSEWMDPTRTFFAGARQIALTYDIALSNANTIGVPLSGTVNVTVNWGDGSTDTYTTPGVKTHTYAGSPGVVNVVITGTLTQFGNSSTTAAQVQALTRIDSFGFEMGLTSLAYACFRTSANLGYVTPALPPTITDMSYMFSESACAADIRGMDVSNVQNMSHMFASSVGSGPQIEGWDVSAVTNVYRMFLNSAFNRPFDNCNWASLLSMSEMFTCIFPAGSTREVAFNQPINGWNVSSVTDMSLMFHIFKSTSSGGGSGRVRFNQPIASWDVSNVTNMRGMFGATMNNNGTSISHDFNQPIGSWDVSNVTNMDFMFGSNPDIGLNGTSGRSSAFNQPLAAWDLSAVTTARGMFASIAYTQDLSTWVLPACTDISYMFAMQPTVFQNGPSSPASNASPNPILQSGSQVWSTPAATAAVGLFAWNSAFDRPLSLWDTSSITDMAGMFLGSKFNQPIGDWDVSNVTNMSRMFCVGYTNNRSNYFDQDIGAWDVSSVTNMERMFGGLGTGSNQVQPFNNGGSSSINNWDVSNVTNMAAMFGHTDDLTQLFNQPIGNWDVSNVTNMSYMFGTRGLNSGGSLFNQPIGSWDVSNVTDMSYMFGVTTAASVSPPRVQAFNQDLSTWQLNPDVNLTGFMIIGGTVSSITRDFSTANYSLLLAGWANYIADVDGPYAKTTAFTGIKYSNATVIAGARFDDGEAGRTFLTTVRSVVVASASDPLGDGVYNFSAILNAYTNANDWYFFKSGGSWKLYDDTDTLQATGTGDVAAPWLSTSWDGDLTSATVLNNGVGWTITDGGLV